MRSVKGFVAAVGVLSVCIAAFGAASASAVPTILCTLPQETCLVGNRLGPTKIETSTTQAIFTNSITNVTCMKSSYITETENESAGPLLANIPTAPLFETCTTAKGAPCTVTAANHPYKAQISWQKNNESLLTVKNGGAGVPGVDVTCGLLINCRFKAETVYEFNGGKPAKIQVTGSKMTGEGPVCPSTILFSGTYTVNSPSPVYPAHT